MTSFEKSDTHKGEAGALEKYFSRERGPSSEAGEGIYDWLIESVETTVRRISEQTGVKFEVDDLWSIAEESGLTSKLENLRQRTFEARRSLRRAFQVVAFSAMTVGDILAPISEARAEETTSISESEREVKRFTEDDLRQAVLKDKFERAFFAYKLVDSDLSGKYEELLGEKGETTVHYYPNDFSLQVNSPDVEVVRVAHTHPLEVIGKVIGQDANSKPIIEMLPAPPSFMDVTSAFTLDEYFGENGNKILHQVYAPGGRWEFRIDDENSTVKGFKKFRRDHVLPWKSLLQLLPPEVRPSALTALENAQHPHELDDLRREGPLRRFIDQTLAHINHIDDRYPEVVSMVLEYERYNRKFLRPKEWVDQSESERDKKISQYLAFCEQHGISMRFIPYEEKE